MSKANVAGMIPARADKVTFYPADVERLTGLTVKGTDMRRILKDLEFGIEDAGDARITSYNVCYTKLLRDDALDRPAGRTAGRCRCRAGWSLEPPELSEAGSQLGARITSYNVCYTKLLRGGIGETVQAELDRRGDHAHGHEAGKELGQSGVVHFQRGMILAPAQPA